MACGRGGYTQVPLTSPHIHSRSASYRIAPAWHGSCASPRDAAMVHAVDTRDRDLHMGATVLPLPASPDELVIRVANDPIWPVPRAAGSAAWEKANLHKALGIALALKG